jgi:predicted CXXCH cytochrome family protein
LQADKGHLSSNNEFETRSPAGPLSWLIVRSFFLLVSLSLVSGLNAIPAQAIGPHGEYSGKTDKCGQCHAMHTAKTLTLLTKSQPTDLCISCHSKGIGADTAVMDGAMMHPTAPGSGVYNNQGTLLGGGFSSLGATASTTSQHQLGLVAPPAGATGASTIELQCLSCHTPHDSANYRSLRRSPGDMPVDVSVAWNQPPPVDDGSGGTVEDYGFTDRIYGTGITYDPITHVLSGTSVEVTRCYKSGISAWCSACHSTYMATNDSNGKPNAYRGPGGTPYNAGDSAGSIVRYRHAVEVPVLGGHNIYSSTTIYNLPTDLPLNDVNNNGRDAADTINCLTCHRAHGTDKHMTGQAILAGPGDRGSLPQGQDSMLLRLDDRQVCQLACHRVVN